MRILAVCFLLATFLTQAQTENLISKTWIIDVKAMEPVIAARLNSNPNFTNLSESEKKIAIQTALDQISKSKVEYRADGTYFSETSSKKKNGKWRFDKDKNILYVSTEDKELVYTLISVSEEKLNLKTDANLTLFFTVSH